jgi:hypothetical protein
VIRSEDFVKDYKRGKDKVQERPNMPGASSSKDHAQVKSVKIKAAKHETQDEDIDIEKVGLSVMLAMSICVAVQWLFGNCKKRKKKAEHPVRIKMMRKKRDEDSEDFELVPSQKDEEDLSVQKETDRDKEQKSEVTLIALKVMLIDAGDNENILKEQSHRIAEMIEDLDEKDLEEYLVDLERFKANLEKQKKKKSCLEALEEIQGLVENQQNEPEEVKEDPTTGPRDPPEDPPLPHLNGRRLYGTRYGEKYHFSTDCKGLNGQPNFGKNPCQRCQQRTKQILVAVIGSASSSNMPSSETGFEVHGSSYHETNCVAFQRYKAKDKKAICYYCLNYERLLEYARNR